MYTAPVMTLKILTLYLDIHPNTVNRYEKCGLIKPYRIKNMRLFSFKDFNRICFIFYLTKEKFYNLKDIKKLFDYFEKNKIKEKHYIFHVDRFKKQLKRLLF